MVLSSRKEPRENPMELNAEVKSRHEADPLAGRSKSFADRVRRKLLADLAWDVLKEALEKQYGFLPSKITERVQLMEFDSRSAFFRDGYEKAGMWADLKAREADLSDDGRWSARLMKEYRTPGSKLTRLMRSDERTAARLMKVDWVRSHRDALVRIFKETHGRGHSFPMDDLVQDLIRGLADPDRTAIRKALRRSDLTDDQIVMGLKCVALEEAYVEQHKAFRAHPRYAEAAAIAKRWDQAADPVTRAIARVEAEDVCGEIHEDAWIPLCDAFLFILHDLEERGEIKTRSDAC